MRLPLYVGFLILGFSLSLKAQAWNSLPSFPGVARDDACGFRIGDSIYLGTGLSPWFSAQEDFWLF